MKPEGCAAARRSFRSDVCWLVATGLLSCCVTESSQRLGKFEVQASAPGSSSTAVGPLVWGLGNASFGREAQEPQGQDPQGQDREQQEAYLRSVLGSTILIAADGRVTKQYFLAGELGNTFLKLITEIVPGQPLVFDPNKPPPPPPPGIKVGGEGSNSILGRMLGGSEIEVTYIERFEDLRGAKIVDPPQPNAPSVVDGSPPPMVQGGQVALLLVTGLPSSVIAFENALNLFYTSIPQVEISVQVIEYTNADALAFGVGVIDPSANPSTPNLQSLSSSRLIQSYTSVFPLRAPVVGSSPVADIGLITIGGIHDSWELNAQLQALEANNLADITSAPTLVVRNGGVASISTLTDIPFPKARFQQLGTNVAVDIAFKPVGVKMNIIPVIAGTDSVLLQISADVSAVTGFASTDPVVTPITSTRNAVTTVYLKNGHSLLIGGLKSESTFQNETKLPLLGDIPLLGLLFRSTSTTHQKTNVAFQITPRIVTDRGAPPSTD